MLNQWEILQCGIAFQPKANNGIGAYLLSEAQ